MKPTPTEIIESQKRVQQWFVQTAPLIEWAAMDSPLGTLYLARNAAGVCQLDFGIDEATFIEEINPLARTDRNRAALAVVMGQLDEYFAGSAGALTCQSISAR